MKRYQQILAFAVVAFTVVACGGPSESEVADLLKQQMQRELEQRTSGLRALGSMMGGSKGAAMNSGIDAARKMVDEIELDVSNVEAVDDRDGVYRATVTATSNGRSNTNQVLVVETNDGWRLLER